MILPRIAACRQPRPLSILIHSCRRTYVSTPNRLSKSITLLPLLRFAPAFQTPQTLPRRPYSDKTLSTPATTTTDTPVTSTNTSEDSEYVGPLSNTFRRLKIFSMASFGLSMTLAPFMFIVESNLPYSARFALASIAIGTSGLSTTLVAWCARPYVNTLRRYKPDGDKAGEVLEMSTSSLFLRPRVTTVFDPEFLLETRRPMAKWELATQMVLPASRSAEGKQLAGTQEIVAETVDHTGSVIGRWIVTWAENGEGVCHESGKMIKYFNVHEELL